MMKTIISLLLCLFGISAASAQELRWRVIPNAHVTLSRIEDACFLNANTGWAVTSYDVNNVHNSYTLKTTDGGRNWATYIDTTLNYMRCVTFADTMTGWVGLLGRDRPQIAKTTNGGMNWFTSMHTPNADSNNVCGIQAINSNLVYACGRWNGPAKFYKTTNGGTNWTIKDMSALATTLIDCYFYSPDSGFIVGGIGPSLANRKAVVLFTSNGGETWVNRYTSTHSGWCWKISFPTKQVGYISVESEQSVNSACFLKTTNGGLTWQEKLLNNQSYDEEGIGFVNENTGWVGGWFVTPRKTTDGGNTWFESNEFPTGGINLPNLNRFRVINDTVAYAVGRSIYKYSRDSIVSVQQISSNVPESFSLKQNFPNPFNPGTKIRFDVVSKTAEIQIIVYNSLGQIVETLIKGKLEAGTYEVEFSADKHPSGVYYYTLVANNYSITKKMMLIK